MTPRKALLNRLRADRRVVDALTGSEGEVLLAYLVADVAARYVEALPHGALYNDARDNLLDAVQAWKARHT